ncbi:MAG: hypothetical protein ABJC10_08965 [Acidobacteriota bacterium]
MQLIQWIFDHWRYGYRFRIVVITALALVLLTLLYPFQSVTVPQWTLKVIDNGGTPVGDINVTEHWQDYVLEAEGHEEAKTTNQNGLVSFDPRKVRASVVRRLLARISKFGSHDAQGRAVCYGAVVVWGKKDYETTVALYQGDVPPAEIRVQRMR